MKACAEVGIESFGVDLPEDVTEEDLLKVGSSSGCGSIKQHLSIRLYYLSAIYIVADIVLGIFVVCEHGQNKQA